MIGFVSQETRRGIQAIDDFRGELARILVENPVVASAFSQTVVTASLKTLDLLFVPNLRHGQIHIPKAYRQTEHVPILPVQPGQTFRFNKDVAAMTEFQSAQAVAAIRRWTGDGTPDVRVDRFKSRLDRNLADRAGGYLSQPQHTNSLSGFVTGALTKVRVPKADFPDYRGSHVIVTGRPIMGLMVPANPADKATALITLDHEMRHVWQALVNPLLPANTVEYAAQSLRFERAAYHQGGQLGVALRDADDPIYKAAPQQVLCNHYVDTFMKMHDDPADPTKLIQALDNHGLGDFYEQQPPL